MHPPRSSRRLVIGAAVLVSLACGGDSITAAPSVNGTYSLQSVNGAALPVTFTDSLDGLPVQVTFMSPTTITLSGTNSVRIITTVRFVFGSINEVQTDTGTGTYALNGQQVTFSQPGSTSFTAAWNGSDMLTINDDGIFVFRK
ncbi:MAG: hypothetical protein JWL61_830 [Gemmatimonadetes bacterium]|jgi:hypothetical protein|nr:hypothetical protein [Gemmatimonadota bacterium]